MRPLKLSLQAFGPFAASTIVDFRGALDSRLFGIYGPTGAGKTSILDGICFALFGESSGNERTGAQLRSDHVDADTETVVSLIFDIGMRRYHVRRRPDQTVQAKRGDKLTTRPHWAALYDATGLEVDSISEANPGQVVAERKVREVDQALEAILGYSASQFRQVVLLPQGKFRELLTAKSDDRSAVLRGLFDVSIYERFVARLKADAAETDATVRSLRQAVQTQLERHDTATTDELQALVDSKRQEQSAAEAACAEAAKLSAVAQLAAERARELERRFAEHDAAHTAHQTLDAQSKQIAVLEARCQAATRAKELVPLAERAQEAAEAIQNAKERLEGADLRARAARTEAKTAKSALEASVAQEDAREVLAGRVQQLARIIEQIKSAEPLAAEAKSAAARASSAAMARDEVRKARRAAETRLEEARGGDEAANARKIQLLSHRNRVGELTQEHEAARTHTTLAAEVRKLSQTAKQVGAEHFAARTALEAARSEEANAEAALSQAQAAHLARKLEPGQPCPVCGSTEHPDLAGGDTRSAGLDKALRDAREKLRSAEAAERTTSSAAVQADTSLGLLQARLTDLAVPGRPLDEITSEKAGLEKELRRLEKLPQPETTSAQLQEASTALQAARTAFEIAQAEHAEADKMATAAKVALESALRDIPEALRAADQARLAQARAERERAAAFAAHKEAMQKDAAAASSLQAAELDLKHVISDHATAVESGRVHQTRLEEKRAALGFDDPAFAKARSDIEQIHHLSARVTEYRQLLAAALDRLARASAALGEDARPDLELIEAEREAAANAARQAERTVATIAAAIKECNQTLAQVSGLDAAIREAEARYATIGELARLADGRNSRNLRLVDFAIMATFDDVLAAANQRFQRMSRGRFALLRKTEAADGRSRSGLGIEVYDAYTDQRRDAHTLSGGEGFLASLSLALGLSDVVQAESGGVKLDAIFIDEGFGHLDDETLDTALETLRDLVGRDRAVGVISHVEAVKHQIPAGFEIVRRDSGSMVQLRNGVRQ